MAFIILTGKRGSGKTALAVKTALDTLRRGGTVWANIPLDIRHLPDTLRARSFWATNIEDIGDMRDGLWILDEAHLLASARNWKTLTMETHAYLSLSRHLGMDIIFVSQNFRRLDAIVRELTDRVFTLRKFVRFTLWREWDDGDINEEGKPKEKAKSLARGVMWHSSKIHKCYDDRDLVLDLLRRRKPREWLPNTHGFLGVASGEQGTEHSAAPPAPHEGRDGGAAGQPPCNP